MTENCIHATALSPSRVEKSLSPSSDTVCPLSDHSKGQFITENCREMSKIGPLSCPKAGRRCQSWAIKTCRPSKDSRRLRGCNFQSCATLRRGDILEKVVFTVFFATLTVHISGSSTLPSVRLLFSSRGHERERRTLGSGSSRPTRILNELSYVLLAILIT